MYKTFDFLLVDFKSHKSRIVNLKRECFRKELLLFVVVYFFSGIFFTCFAQSKITLNLRNVSIKDALKEIEKQSDFTFVYNDSKIDVNKTIDINVKDCSIEEVLDKFFIDNEILYTSIDKHIVLTRQSRTDYRMPAISNESAITREDMSVREMNPMEVLSSPQKKIMGKVVSVSDGLPIPGVNIIVKGSTVGTNTDGNGAFTVNAPVYGVLIFSFLGYERKEIAISGRSQMEVALNEETQQLKEIIVIGYGTQAKKDITGSVATIDAEKLQSQPATNLGVQLAGRAAGVTISSSGDPSSGVSIRIRGIGSINDNGPLIVIDGISTRDQNLNSLNPNDVETVQILKDASAASIYGSQASNGVIIITTKKGSKERTNISYDGYYGVQKIVKSFDLLDTQGWINMWQTASKNTAILRNWGQGRNINRSYQDLFNDESLWTSDKNYTDIHPQFGSNANPQKPNFIIPTGADYANEKDWAKNNRITKLGNTNWMNEITQVASIQNHQLSASGGSEKGVYSLGLNYYDQEGIIKFTKYQRYSFRANSEFIIKKHIKIGENFTLSRSQNHSAGNQDEGWGLSMAYRMVPWIPVYDVAGNFAGTAAAGSGNAQNPYAMIFRGKDDTDITFRSFGNIFLEFTFLKDFTFQSNFGIDYKNGSGYSLRYPNPEFSEGSDVSGFSEYSNWSLRWVYSNTLTYTKIVNDIHHLTAVIGSEAIRDGLGRQLEGNRTGYLFIGDKNTWTLGNGDPNTMTNNSYFWGDYSLFGVFGRIDYSLKDKYLVTAIVRRDGVSRFSPEDRYGIFPSLSLGWRISKESFMRDISWVDDLKFRAGYGVTGNAEIPNAYNYSYTYGLNAGDFNYAIQGQNNGANLGIRLTKYGNVDTKWEQSQMANVGIDASLFNHFLEMNVEGYVKKTSGMLVSDDYSSLAGGVTPPYVNLGEMMNTGFDISLTNRGTIVGDFKYDVTANLSHYKNEVIKISDNPEAKFYGGSTRFGNVTVITKGEPISSFYGYQIEGIFKNQSELLNHAKQPGINNSLGDFIQLGNDGKPVMDGNGREIPVSSWMASLGKFKFKDINGDGIINEKDKTILGSPHPKFTYGIDINLYYKSFELNMFLMGSQGNKIFDYVKYWTDFNGSFTGNKSQYMVENSWNPTTDAERDTKLPILVLNDNDAANNPSSYYVEDGSFMRCKNFQISYSIPKSLIKKIGVDNYRIYLQVTNLFTLTNYSGIEPDLGTRWHGGGSEWDRGLDFGAYPHPRQFIFGMNLSF
jgi:TonB-linked SusC/RagA family outer membrane protein